MGVAGALVLESECTNAVRPPAGVVRCVSGMGEALAEASGTVFQMSMEGRARVREAAPKVRSTQNIENRRQSRTKAVAGSGRRPGTTGGR